MKNFIFKALYLLLKIDLTIPKDKGPSIKFLAEGELEILCELQLIYVDDYKVHL